MGTFVGSGRHCNRAARDDVGNDLMSGVTGEDYIWSFGVVREHPTDFFAGAEAYYAEKHFNNPSRLTDRLTD